MARRSLKRKFREKMQEPNINITPLIDVVFVVLIAFIIIAPLLELDRIDLANGEHVASHMPIESQKSSPLQIHVHKDSTLFVNREKVTVQMLPEYLKKMKSRYPSARPQLFQDRKAEFGTYQSVKNALELAGFEELDIVLSPS